MGPHLYRNPAVTREHHRKRPFVCGSGTTCEAHMSEDIDSQANYNAVHAGFPVAAVRSDSYEASRRPSNREVNSSCEARWNEK